MTAIKAIKKPMLAAAAAAASIHALSMLTLDRTVSIKETTLGSVKIKGELSGYRIMFISDIHSLSEQALVDIADKANGLHPDLLVLGGDFPSRGEKLDRVMGILSRISAADGIYGVEGNHDYYKDLFMAMKRHSITPLSNSGAHVRSGLYLAGTQDIRNRRPDIKKAIKAARSGDFVILASHNPDVSMMQDTKAVDLILSGHNHGGHITCFGVWAPALALHRDNTAYGQRFMSGWAFSRDGAPVYVSNGVGSAGLPRVFARPRIDVLTLLPAD